MKNIIFIPYMEEGDIKVIHWVMDKNALWILTKEPQKDGSKGRLNTVRNSTLCRAKLEGEWIDTWLCNIIKQPEYWNDEQQEAPAL